MARFHLQARLIEGSPAAPGRDELQKSESEDAEHLRDLAVKLSGRGFTVWMFRHTEGTHVPPHLRYRLIETRRPSTAVARSSPCRQVGVYEGD